MKIVTLLENSTLDKKLTSAHGLSLYIETNDKKILFDVGQKNYFVKNAKKLGVSLEEVDILVISHGHYDHGGGLSKFLKLNKTAEIYLSRKAFDDHVKVKGSDFQDIGIGKTPKVDRFHYIDQERKEIVPGVILCDKVPFKRQIIGDNDLMIYENGRYMHDHFDHEIYMIVKEHNNTVLFTGCSHKGIENIVDHIEQVNHMALTHIFGGLHFSHYDSLNFKETDYLMSLAEKLGKKQNLNIFAGHCTGEDAFFELKKGLKERLQDFKTGSVIEI